MPATDRPSVTPSLRTSSTRASPSESTATRIRLGSACLRAFAIASLTTACAIASSSSASRSPGCQATSMAGSLRTSRESSTSSVVVGCRRPADGRARAERSSEIASRTSLSQRSRSETSSGPSTPSASEVANSLWMTRSCTSLVSAIRSASRRERSRWLVPRSTEKANAASRASVSIRRTSSALIATSTSGRSAKITPSHSPLPARARRPASPARRSRRNARGRARGADRRRSPRGPPRRRAAAIGVSSREPSIRLSRSLSTPWLPAGRTA